MFEVKVDVHAEATPISTPQKSAVKDPYGPWCRPEAKPGEFKTKSPKNQKLATEVKINYDDLEFIDAEPEGVPKRVNGRTETKKDKNDRKLSLRPKFLKSPSARRKSIDYDVIEDTSIELHEIVRRSIRKRRRKLAKNPTVIEDDGIEEAPPDLNENNKSSFDSGIIANVSLSPSSSKIDLDLDTPQSPVPKIEAKAKYFNGFLSIFSICDPYVPIDPQGKRYIAWLFIVTICYSYNSWCIPLRAIFPYQTTKNTPYWMAFDYLCDFIYFLDLSYVKPKLMYLEEGFWVTDPKATRSQYKRKLQYMFDVLSLLPLDILYIYYGPQKVILRLPRLLKLQTFWDFYTAMDRTLSSPYIVRVGKSLYYIFYLIHLNACAYYGMSLYEGLASNDWVYDNRGNAYLRCFFFATKTATSIGKTPKPENLSEYMFMTAAWLMGVFVFAVLIGQIRDIIATATRAREEYRMKLDKCTKYLRKQNIHHIYQTRVSTWFQYTWKTQRCFDEAKILSYLPHNMRLDVALEVHMGLLSKVREIYGKFVPDFNSTEVQLFRDCSESLLRDLVLKLKPETFVPGDIVVQRGHIGHHMYIIQSGECQECELEKATNRVKLLACGLIEYLFTAAFSENQLHQYWNQQTALECRVMSEDEKEVLATLREGSVFGEISLLGIDGLRTRTATVRSRGFSSLFALSKKDLDSSLQYHNEAAQILRLKADQIIRENAVRDKARQDSEERVRSISKSTLVRQSRVSITSERSDENVGIEDANGKSQTLKNGSDAQVEAQGHQKITNYSTKNGSQSPIPSIDLSLHRASIDAFGEKQKSV